MKKAWCLLVTGLILAGSNAFAMGQKPPGGDTNGDGNTGGTPSLLKNSLSISAVKVTKENGMAGGWGEQVSCKAFSGTHAGNKVTIRVAAEGGDGNYEHTIVYSLTRAYDLGNKDEGQREVTRKGNGDVTIEIPKLQANIPFVDQPVLLSTRDGSGHTATKSISFRVSRPVILQPSTDTESVASNCYERLAPYESAVGVISNGSTNPSDINVTQGLERSWTSTRGWQWGVWVSPFTKWADILSLGFEHFTETSKQITESVSVSSSYTVNPGDFMQVYIQPTRYVTSYDATTVGPCGEIEKHEGVYRFQWWGFAYHVYPVNPLDPQLPPREAIGAPVANTCPATLSMDAGRRAGNPLEFWRTN